MEKELAKQAMQFLSLSATASSPVVVVLPTKSFPHLSFVPLLLPFPTYGSVSIPVALTTSHACEQGR